MSGTCVRLVDAQAARPDQLRHTRRRYLIRRPLAQPATAHPAPAPMLSTRPDGQIAHPADHDLVPPRSIPIIGRPLARRDRRAHTPAPIPKT